MILSDDNTLSYLLSSNKFETNLIPVAPASYLVRRVVITCFRGNLKRPDLKYELLPLSTAASY